MNDRATVEYLIKNNRHMTLATAGEYGKPWSTPVFFAYDGTFNVYWVSAKDARHSQNVRGRPEIGVSIFGPVPPSEHLDGVYFDAQAAELVDVHEVEAAISVLHQRPQPGKFTVITPKDVLGEATWRIYRAVPSQIFKRSDAQSDDTDQAISVRKAIDLS